MSNSDHHLAFRSSKFLEKSLKRKFQGEARVGAKTEKESKEDFNRMVDFQQVALTLLPAVGTMSGVVARLLSKGVRHSTVGSSLSLSLAVGLYYWSQSP